jgi:outer membrane protein OmpA-like peptidoglycan-associated protein
VPFALTNTAGGPTRITAVSGGGQHAMATAAFTTPLVVKVQDAFDNPVPGVTVTFTAPGSGASATLAAGTSVTDGSGLAQVTPTANPLLGEYTITASVAGLMTPATFTLTNDQTSTAIALTANTLTPASQDLVTLTATLTSPLGAPTGVVHLVIDSGPSIDATVDGNGRALVRYRFVELGKHLVVATYDGDGRYGPSAWATLELTVGRDAGSIGGGGCSIGPRGHPRGGHAWLTTLAGLGLCGLLRRRPRSSRRDSRSRARSVTRARTLAAVALAALGLCQAGAARAQSTSTRGFALDRFMPSAAGSDWFAGDSLRIEDNLRPVFGVSADYDVNPLVLYNSDGSRRAVPVKGQLFLHAGGSLSLMDRFRIAVDLPIAPYQAGDSGVYNGEMIIGSNSGGVGDLAVALDARLVGRYGQAFTLGAGAQLFLPTGSRDKFLGEGSVRAMPRIAAAGTVSMFMYSAQLGVMLREQSKFAGVDRGTDLTFAAAAGVAVLDRRLIVGPEVYGATGVGKWASDNAFRQLPVEAMLGAHYRVTSEWRLGATAAIGVSQGLGSPAQRVLLSTEWSPSRAERHHSSPAPVAMSPPPPLAPAPPSDRDGDHVPDNVDACLDVAGIASDDPKTTGCPPPDGDADGIPDNTDACPAVAGIGSDDPTQNGCPSRASVAPISERIFFRPLAARLNRASIEVLTRLVITLKAAPQIRISVDGHSDDLGKDALNQELSHKRASAAVDWLIAHGVPAQQLQPRWYSNQRPAVPKHDAVSRRANRRVELREDASPTTPRQAQR